jgi:DNA-binding GntR family transcriptional regulator
MQAVQKRSAEMLATDELRNSIVTGGLEPGTRLTEINLSDRLQVSRGTVRSALQLLSVEGLVTLVPYTGWSVMRLSSRDAWELYTLRASLESLAARLAAEELSATTQTSLDAALASLIDACASHDQKAIADRDFDLHKTIVDASGHKRLVEQYRLVEQQVRTYIASSDALISDPSAIVAQHEPILAAIFARKSASAAKLSEAHNITEGTKLMNYLRRHEASAANI